MLDRRERRVVAEAAGPAGLGGERPLAAALDDVLAAARLDVRQRAHVGQGAARRGLAEQLVEVLLVGGVLAGEARAAHAGRAAERLRRDARVVRDGRASGRRRGGARLAERVLGE